jgi:hypothetical protein
MSEPSMIAADAMKRIQSKLQLQLNIDFLIWRNLAQRSPSRIERFPLECTQERDVRARH